MNQNEKVVKHNYVLKQTNDSLAWENRLFNYGFYVDNNNFALKTVTLGKRICKMPKIRLYN